MLECHYAVALLGAVVVNLSPALVPAELVPLLASARPTAMVADAAIMPKLTQAYAVMDDAPLSPSSLRCLLLVGVNTPFGSPLVAENDSGNSKVQQVAYGYESALAAAARTALPAELQLAPGDGSEDYQVTSRRQRNVIKCT